MGDITAVYLLYSTKKESNSSVMCAQTVHESVKESEGGERGEKEKCVESVSSGRGVSRKERELLCVVECHRKHTSAPFTQHQAIFAFLLLAT